MVELEPNKFDTFCQSAFDFLNEAGVRYLVIGGLAVVAIGRVREHCTDFRKTGPVKISRSDVRRAHELLNDRYRDSISLDELASEVRSSKYELCRMFSTYIGVSPHRYLLHVRTSRACDLLRRGVSSSAAAAEVGFCDQQHMSKVFKRLLGMTPTYFIDLQQRTTKSKSYASAR